MDFQQLIRTESILFLVSEVVHQIQKPRNKKDLCELMTFFSAYANDCPTFEPLMQKLRPKFLQRRLTWTSSDQDLFENIKLEIHIELQASFQLIMSQ